MQIYRKVNTRSILVGRDTNSANESVWKVWSITRKHMFDFGPDWLRRLAHLSDDQMAELKAKGWEVIVRKKR
ncbi:MAG: hypothetical protein AMXMBFR7_50670 [Planctomycetota bacterium]